MTPGNLTPGPADDVEPLQLDLQLQEQEQEQPQEQLQEQEQPAEEPEAQQEDEHAAGPSRKRPAPHVDEEDEVAGLDNDNHGPGVNDCGCLLSQVHALDSWVDAVVLYWVSCWLCVQCDCAHW